MKDILLASIIALFSAHTAQSQYLVSSELLQTYTAGQLNIVPLLTAEYDVEMYKIIYNTVDAVGEPTIASGAFTRPLSDECVNFPMMMYHHGTTLSKEDVPSRNNGEALFCNLGGGLGYYSMAPDYVGMGDSPGLHPYQHALSEATAGVDMLRAVREFLASINEMDNGEVFITGYSQGGHAAMAMHKYIEDNDLLDEIDIIASAPLSGAYDMSGSQADVILSGEPYSNPGYIVYVMASFELAYGNIYDTYSDILQSPYDEIVVPFFNGNNTTLTMGSLNSQLPGLITDLMLPSEYAAFESDLSHPLRVALEANDVYDWTPQRTVRMYYCTADEQVDFSNSVTALETMQANGAADVSATALGELNHGDCVLPALLGAIGYFNSVRTECQANGLEEEFRISVALYPNPARDKLFIKSEKRIDSWKVMDALGHTVERSQAKKRTSSQVSLELDVSDFESGVYQLHLECHDGQFAVQSFVVEH